MSSARPPQPQRPVVEALETKLLYSADVAPMAFLAAEVSASSPQLAAPTDTARTELVFIDASVPDLQSLVDDLRRQSEQGRRIDVIVIQSGDDGLHRITEELAGRQDVSAVHLLGHGQEGRMQLGLSTLDASTLLHHAQDVAAWGESLTAEADILLYGCDVATSEAGRALTRDLAQLTGSDVAASDDPTGHLSLGGDWLLEFSTGSIEARTALSETAMAQWTGLLAEATPGGKGTAVWNETGLTGPQQAAWDGLTLGAQGSTSLSNTWKVISSASSPTRDEAIVVGVDANGAISGQIWNGTQWSALTLPFPTTGANPTRQGFAVAYEQISGDAMLVWNNGSTLQYSVFNGTSWTTAQSVSAYTGAEPERIQIAAQPGGDGMAMTISSAVVGGKVTDYALIWNGNSWGHAITLDTTGENVEDQLTTAVAYESVSGRAMVAFTKYSTSNYGTIDYNVYYQIFNGSTWSSAVTAGNYTETAIPYTLTLASDPHSNRVAFGMVGAGLTVGFNYQVINSFAVWNGSSWGPRHTYSFVVGSTSSMGPSVSVGFESVSGDALAVYGTASNTLRYATWSPTTNAWTAGASTIPLSAAGQTVRLYADPVSNHLVAGVTSTDGALTFTDWNGSTWGVTSTVASQTGSAASPAFTWFWQNPRLDATPNDLWLGSAQDTTGWTGVNAVSDTEVLAFEGSHPEYGAGTSGAFSHLFDLGAFGASGLDDIVWVTREVLMNPALTLQRGDVLFTVTNDCTLSSTNTKAISRNDVVLFRPDKPGDYSSGTFSILIQGLGDGSDVKGLALVEQTVQMGDVTLQTGEVLFSMGTGSTGSDIYRFQPSTLDLGTGLLSGLYSTLITGSEIGVNQVIKGLEVITSVTALSHLTLPAGSLLLSFEQAGVVGTPPIAVDATDVVLVTPSLTSAGGSTAQATAEVIFKGNNVGITSGHIDTLALSRQTPPSIVQPGTGISTTVAVNENQTAVTTVQATDPDAGTTLSYRIAGGADAAMFTMNSATGQLTFVNAPDREQPGDLGGDNVYDVIVAASDGDLEDFQTLAVTVNDINESPAITSDGGGATASIQMAETQTLATTVQAVDPEGATVSYAISGGADAALFSIHATTGALTFLQAPNASTPQDSGADNVYDVTVSASVGADTDTQQLQITVLALNRPPVNTLLGSLSLFEDSSMTISGIQVADVDAGSATIQVSFSVQHGTISIGSTAPGGLTSADLVYSPDERHVTLTGTLAQINATLGSSQALTYRPDSNFHGSDTLTMVSDDLGNSGASGTPAQNTDTDSTSLTIKPVNDAPVVDLGGSDLTYLENDPALPLFPGLNLSDIDSTTLTRATIRIDSGYVSGEDLLSFTPTSGLTSAWDATTGTLTLSGTASLATYQTALRSISYLNSSESPMSGLRTISVRVSDGELVNPGSVLVSRNIQLTSVLDAPTLQTSSPPLTYTENSGGLIIDSGLQIGDADSTTLQSATVQIVSGHVIGRDQLVFVDQNGITGAWTASTGTLELSGTASLADYQSALRSVVYRHVGDAPGSVDRVVAFTVNDGDLDSVVNTRTIEMVPVNDAPVLTMNGGSLVHEENAAPTPVAPNLTLSDPDNSQLSSASVQVVSAHVPGEDVLTYTGVSGITGTWDGDQGILTLSGLATVEDYQLALRSVVYQNLSEAPSDATRTLVFLVNDGNLSSNAGTCELTVLPVADAPVVTPGIAVLTYTENDAPLLVAGTALTLTDVDSTTLSSAVLAIGSGYTQGQDLLSFVDTSGITGVWSEAAGTLTLSGQASLADYQAALRSITYTNSSDRPSDTPREFTLTVHDGLVGSTPVSWNLNLQTVNDAPVLATDGSTPSYTENAAPTPVGHGLTISDLDDEVLSQATVHLIGHVPGQDVLSFSGTSGITAQWDASAGVLTLTGNASIADYEAALALVNYINLSDAPDTSPRTIEITVSDGSQAQSLVVTRVLTITALNDAPVLSSVNPGVSYLENAPATWLHPGLFLSDADNSLLSGATVWISAGHAPGQDLLSMDAPAGISSHWDADTGILTLSGSASLADYEAALRSVRYTNLSDAPAAGERTVSFQIHDSNDPSAVLTQTVAVSAINDAPVLTPSVSSITHLENAAQTWLDTGLSLSDADSPTLVGATLQITGNHAPSQDRLSFVTQAGIEGTWDAASGTLALTGLASVSDYQAALRSVVYLNDSDDPSTASRSITLVLDDGGTDHALSEAVQYTLHVIASNDAPTIVSSTGALNYMENSTPVLVDAQISLADLDNDMLSGATVKIGEGFTPGQDLLAFTDAYGIVGTWDADSGTLSLSGEASVADYQSALGSVTYSNISDHPDTGPRVLLLSVSDGHVDNSVSATATRTLTITPINDAPNITSTGTVSLSYTENSGAVPLGYTVILNDVDNLTLQGATVRIQGHYVQGQDVLALAQRAGITSSWNTETGTLSLHGSASLADYQDALQAITYTNTSDAPDGSTRTLSIEIHDGETGSAPMVSPAVTWTVIAVNDAPVVSLHRLIIQQGGQASPELVITDAEQTTDQLLLTAQAVSAGQFVELSSGQAIDHFTVAALQSGAVVFVHDGSGAIPSYQLTVSDGMQSTVAPAPDVAMSRTIQIGGPVSPPETTTDSNNGQEEATSGETASDEATSAASNLVTETRTAGSADDTTPQRLTLDLQRAALTPPPTLEFSMPSNPVRISIESPNRTSWTSGSADAQMNDFSYRWTGSLQSGGAAQELNRSLNALREQLSETSTGRQQVMVSSIALTTGLSMGYVIWLLRGGALLGSMLSSMPLWGMIDPLPILNRASGKHALADGTDADAPLEQLFDGDHPTPPPAPDISVRQGKEQQA